MNFRQLVVMATLGGLPLGCSYSQRHRLVFRPQLGVQVQTRVIEILPSGWSPNLSWQRGQLAPNPDPSAVEKAAVTPSPAMAAAFGALVTETARTALADEVVVAGGSTGTRFVRSSRPAPPRLDQLPGLSDAPPDRAVYVVSVDRLSLLGPSEPGALLFFGVSLGARALVSPAAAVPPATAVPPSAATSLSSPISISNADPDVAAGEKPAIRANTAPFYVTAAEWDPRPRTLPDWLANGGQALRASLEQLIHRGAGRLATEFAGTAGTSSSRSCGPRPSSPEQGRSDVTPRDGPLRWEPWAPVEAAAARATVDYDVRIFRLENGAATPVASLGGLADAHAELPPLETGAVYAWTVRGRLTFPDGRKLASPWWSEVPKSTDKRTDFDYQQAGWLCLLPLDPWRAQRFQAGGEASAGAPPATGPASLASPVALDPVGRLPPLARRAGLRRVEVAPLGSVTPVAGYQPGELNLAGVVERGAGSQLASGILGGAGAGALMSLMTCGPLAPLCAIAMVPAGAVIGLTVEGVKGAVAAAAVAGSRFPGNEPSVRAARGMGDALEDGAPQARLVEAVSAALPAAGAGESTAPEARLEVGIVGATFLGALDSDPGMAFEVTVGARLAMADGSEGYRTARLTFPTPIRGSLWLRDDGALLRGALGETLARSGPAVIDAILRSPDEAAPRPSQATIYLTDPLAPLP